MCSASRQRVHSSKLVWFWSCFGFFCSVQVGNSSYSVWHEHDTCAYYWAKYIPWALENWYGIELLELTLSHYKTIFIQAQKGNATAALQRSPPFWIFTLFPIPKFYKIVRKKVLLASYYFSSSCHYSQEVQARSHLDFLAAYHWCNHSMKVWNRTLG